MLLAPSKNENVDSSVCGRECSDVFNLGVAYHSSQLYLFLPALRNASVQSETCNFYLEMFKCLYITKICKYDIFSLD